jgi:hypothetical protein
LVAVASGATLAAVLARQRWAVPMLPVGLLAMAVAGRMIVGRLAERADQSL